VPEAFVFPATWAIALAITAGGSFIGIAISLAKYMAGAAARSAENATNLANMQGQLSVITPLVPAVATLTAEVRALQGRADAHGDKLQTLHAGHSAHAVAIAEIRAQHHQTPRRQG
jgi:hypothetical protein